MDLKLSQKKLFFSPTRLFFAFILLLGGVFCLTLFGCNRNVDYFSYVSEFRNNIFLAENDKLSLRIYSVTKENPYLADGVAHESTPRTEIFLLAPDGTQTYTLTLRVDGKEYGGELSYDNVKSEYFLSFSLDVSSFKELPCLLTYGERQVQLTAVSVLRNETVEAETVLKNVRTHSPELFESMTDKYGFLGEIYLRLLYEDAPYYYVGVINRKGEIHAFLVNATTGKVLAHRKP